MADQKPTEAAEEAATAPEAPATKPAPDSKPVAVKFEKSWGLYNKGETAGFTPEKAEWLIAQKLAVKA